MDNGIGFLNNKAIFCLYRKQIIQVKTFKRNIPLKLVQKSAPAQSIVIII